MIFPIKWSFLFVAFIEQNVHCLQLIGMQILPENESAGKFLKKTQQDIFPFLSHHV